MDILIICTRFPPDNAIASVRPYMFSKYLARLGHNVTVIRSGEISAGADNVYPIDGIGIEVYSYLGADCAAERFLRGEEFQVKKSNSRISFVPERPRKIIAKVFHKLNAPKEFYDTFKNAKINFEKHKVVLDDLKSNGRSYDTVFATYGGLENVYAGEYAAKLFNCKYILDLRDPIALKSYHNVVEYRIMKRFQRKAILASDICTVVSEELSKTLRAYIPQKEIVTLYNGYEPSEQEEANAKPENGKLSFCYTGQLYEKKRDASPLFRSIAELNRKGIIEKDNIIFRYAGHNFEGLREQAEKYGVEDILENYGYLDRSEIQKLQSGSDIFVVLSWNLKNEHGVLTGKFYEGIRCRRPILALISGSDPDSELAMMQSRYSYGLCVEEAQGEVGYQILKEWLKNAYMLKTSNKGLPYTASEEFSLDFRYDILTDKLNRLI